GVAVRELQISAGRSKDRPYFFSFFSSHSTPVSSPPARERIASERRSVLLLIGSRTSNPSASFVSDRSAYSRRLWAKSCSTLGLIAAGFFALIVTPKRCR